MLPSVMSFPRALTPPIIDKVPFPSSSRGGGPLWVEMVWNRRIQSIDKNLFPMSSGVSERASDGMSAAERCECSEQCGASE